MASQSPIESPEIYTGAENLAVMSQMVNYNKWIYSMIERYLGKNVLEAGCGNGNITRLILKKKELEHYVGIDFEPAFCERLKKMVAASSLIPNEFHALDLQKADLQSVVRVPIDSIVCLNVLEHIEQDQLVLEKFYKLLTSSGHLVMQVPAFQMLYGTIDEIDGHFRRYARKELEDKVRTAGFQVLDSFYFNLMGILAWVWHGKIKKTKLHPKNEVQLFDKAVRGLALMESIIRPPVGLSLFIMARK